MAHNHGRHHLGLPTLCFVSQAATAEISLVMLTNFHSQGKWYHIYLCTALMFATLAGHEKVAKLLLDHRAEINVESDSNKDSPLTFACWKGHEKVVKLFLKRRTDIEHRTKEGFSPQSIAIRCTASKLYITMHDAMQNVVHY